MAINSPLDSGLVESEEESNNLDPEMVARVISDPSMTEAMAQLQSEACDTLAAMIDAVAQSLPVAPQKASSGQNIQAIANASRHAALEAKERRELAEALVIGALLNRDNPDWNPRDPSTHRPNYENPLVKILLNGQDEPKA